MPDEYYEKFKKSSETKKLLELEIEQKKRIQIAWSMWKFNINSFYKVTDEANTNFIEISPRICDYTLFQCGSTRLTRFWNRLLLSEEAPNKALIIESLWRYVFPNCYDVLVCFYNDIIFFAKQTCERDKISVTGLTGTLGTNLLRLGKEVNIIDAKSRYFV